MYINNGLDYDSQSKANFAIKLTSIQPVQRMQVRLTIKLPKHFFINHVLLERKGIN